MAMFVSYARQDRETVASLKADLERLGREVWIDEKLRGGQEWWDEILAAIRSCEVFVWTVSPTSVKSTACKAELGYAFALGRPVLPIMIKSVAIGLTPERIANSQIVDYTTRGADQAIKLAGDLQAVQSPPPLPETLPEPPPVPVSYLEPFAVRVSAPSQLSSSDQREVLDFLRPLATSMEDP
ncbi:MAG: toll/interleukin-1 receptor domain-containing protein, partial [Acidimicrobiales bacterium]